MTPDAPAMRLLLSVLLLNVGTFVWAQDPGDTKRLEVELNRLRQEQHAVYQQFQMLQALQYNENQEADPMTAPNVPDGQAPNYDDAVRAKRERQDRLRGYSQEMRRLSERHQALEARAASLLEEIRAGAGNGR